VAEQRTAQDPPLTTAALREPRHEVPRHRYEMAGGCYDLGGVPVTFQATDLGSYLLYGPERRYLAGALFGGGTAWQLRTTTGCAPYPEVELNVDGPPHAGVTPYQEVRGYVDAHTHGMAYEFLGGKVHCGRPWHRYGAPSALVDCDDPP
jgi:hypothetical protein